MEASQKRLFEHDRRMELKMRIAATRMGVTTKAPSEVIRMKVVKPELIGRLIERVRKL
ncbi:MAG: hypothetical protein PVI78_08005 [Anaerolineales bacterium]|jgi:hypothetical protein